MNKAKAAAKAGRYQEALEGFLWCFDHGAEADEAFVGVQGSFLVGDILTLGEVYPPALHALLSRRDEKAQRLADGTASYEDAHDFVAINRYLGQEEFTLRVFRTLEPGDECWKTLGWGIRELLLERRSYEELLLIFHPETVLEQQVRSLDISVCDGGRSFASHLKDKLVRACAPLVEALAALGHHERARRLTESILAVTRTESVLTRLIGHAERAGDRVLSEYLSSRRPKRRQR